MKETGNLKTVFFLFATFMNNTVATPIHIIINSYSIGDPDGVPCRLCVEYNAFEG